MCGASNVDQVNESEVSLEVCENIFGAYDIRNYGNGLLKNKANQSFD